jgi:hypothetical protein
MTKKGVKLSATSCHVLWKYLAYGAVIAKSSNEDDCASAVHDNIDEVDIDSDLVRSGS